MRTGAYNNYVIAIVLLTLSKLVHNSLCCGKKYTNNYTSKENKYYMKYKELRQCQSHTQTLLVQIANTKKVVYGRLRVGFYLTFLWSRYVVSWYEYKDYIDHVSTCSNIYVFFQNNAMHSGTSWVSAAHIAYAIHIWQGYGCGTEWGKESTHKLKLLTWYGIHFQVSG